MEETMDFSKILDQLTKRGFDAAVFEGQKELKAALKNVITATMTVGFGGSLTLRQLKVPELINNLGASTLDHWKEGLSRDEDLQLRLDQGRCDLFMTSVNACTEDGRLVLVDGVGNRVAAAIFGPKEVIHLFGTNKIVPDIHAAMERIRKIAGPKRAASLNMKTPCVEKGECQDCRSPSRICRARVVIDYAPMLTPTRVWIVKGDYGF